MRSAPLRYLALPLGLFALVLLALGVLLALVLLASATRVARPSTAVAAGRVFSFARRAAGLLIGDAGLLPRVRRP